MVKKYGEFDEIIYDYALEDYKQGLTTEVVTKHGEKKEKQRLRPKYSSKRKM